MEQVYTVTRHNKDNLHGEYILTTIFRTLEAANKQAASYANSDYKYVYKVHCTMVGA